MDKKYAIFDMDGTLVDSMPCWKNLAAEYLRGKGVGHIPPELPERIRAMTILESAELFKEEFGLTGDVAGEMNALLENHYRRDIPLKPGIREYLDALSRRGVQMCVASATAEHLMEAALTRLGVRKKFSFLLSCETVGAGKHRPEVYLAAAEKLGGKPEDIAVYEDALYALETAKAAGFYTVGVYDESGDWEKVKATAHEILKC